MKLTDGLYAYPWTNPSVNNCNSFLIRSKTAVLVDPGHMQHMNQLIQSLRLDGIHEDIIHGVICTHAHPDHMEGLQAFANRDVWTAVGLKEEAYLRQIGGQLNRMMGMSVPVPEVDIFLKEGELLLGGERFQVLETPGHTPGSISIYWPSMKTLITGDVVFEMGVGRTDFPGGDGKALVQSIERLSELDIEILLPGHGNLVAGKERVERNFELIRETYYGYL